MEVLSSDYANFHSINVPERSPTQSPMSASSSPEQRHSPRCSSQEQSLHIIVEPQRDGQTNLIHLMNPPSGQILSSFIAEHGAHIEIQPGVFFRVPFPHEHGYHPYGTPPVPLQPQAYQSPIPNNIIHTTETIIQNEIPMQRHFHNPTCPTHGMIANNNGHVSETCDERLEKRREKLQKRLREKNGRCNQCTCHKGEQFQESYSYTTKGNMSDIEITNTQEIENDQDPNDETDLTVYNPPKVIPQSPYCIIVSWDECISNNSDLLACHFELELSNKGNNYKCIYSGNQTSFTAQNLLPGTEYHFRLCALLNGRHGSYSDIASCTTHCTVPEKPLHPRITHTTKNALTLKWIAPPDGGSPILQYKLQWCKGEDSSSFTDLYVGLQRQYKHNHKLPPVTPCMFRLQAQNQHGDSEFSDVLECLTSAGPPNAPDKPKLDSFGIDFITLSWTSPESNGASIEEYRLEMEDTNDGYGFMPKYCGEKTIYTCTNLWRNTCYKFRLMASNNQGSSKYSTPVEYSTLAEIPGKMDKPKLNGKVKPSSIPVKWDPPNDNGGEEIIGYVLEISSGDGCFKEVYRGNNREFLIEQLRPGHTYQIQVASETNAGISPWSTAANITTVAISPRDVKVPRISKQDMTALYLEWDPPAETGGATITNYILKMAETLQDEFKQVYSGPKSYCALSGLKCGTKYYFKLLATNSAGSSPWSETVMLETAPGPPDAPSSLTYTFKSPTHLRFDWTEPATHGTPVTGYIVQKLENETFQKVYQGNCLFCELKRNLDPASIYFFRIQALSNAGGSAYSNICTVETPPGPPGPVTEIKVIEQTSNSCLIQWRHPVENGSRVYEYVIEATGATSLLCSVQRPKFISSMHNNSQENVKVESTSDDESGNESDEEALIDSSTASDTSSSAAGKDDIMEYRLSGLTADASYKLRLQAVNRVGASPFSHAVPFFTKELPPSAPSLNASTISYHSIKLKWADSMSSKKSMAVLNHNLQVQNKSGSFSSAYNGMGTSFTLSKLKELTPYCCRIRSKNDAGEGEFSRPKIFYTKAQPPSTIKEVKFEDVTECSLRLSWNTCEKIRSDDVIEYIVQKFHENAKDFSQIYRGLNTTIKVSELQPEQLYQFRVQSVRELSDVACLNGSSTIKEIKGIYSPVCRVRTLSEQAVELDDDDELSVDFENDEDEKRRLSDKQIALFILGSFLGICILTAALLKWVILIGEY